MEKRSDISRDSFRPEQGYTSVRLQQGRPQLDADWNEQTELQLQRERTALADLLGPAVSVPVDPLQPVLSPRGFTLDVTMGNRGPTAVRIRGGRTYLDGRVIDATQHKGPFTNQPFCPNLKLPDFGPPITTPPASLWIAYLETFEREVTAMEDPALREVALGGPDTTTRTQQAWQVRLREIPPTHALFATLSPALRRLAVNMEAGTTLSTASLDQPELAALAPGRFTPDSDSSDLIRREPGRLQARFVDQGATLENRLYRVEITDVSAGQVRIRWSRDNGAVVALLRRSEAQPAGGQILILTRPSVGDASLFAPGQWLEINTAGSELRGDPPQYRRIQAQGTFEAGEVRVPIEGTVDLAAFPQNDGGVKVRLWNSSEDDRVYPLPVALSSAPGGGLASDFIRLEDGVQVRLELPPSAAGSGTVFRFAAGQYWQIPMRAALSGIDWPTDAPARPAQENRHSYLVLGALLAADVPEGLNRPFGPAWVYLTLRPRAVNSLPDLDQRVQQISNNLDTVIQDRIGPLEGTIFRIRTNVSISPVLFTSSTERPVDVTPRLSGINRNGFITLLYLLDGTQNVILNGGVLGLVPPTVLQPQGPVRQLVLNLRVPVSTVEIRLDMRVLAVYVRDRTDGDLTVSSTTVAGAPFAPPAPR